MEKIPDRPGALLEDFPHFLHICMALLLEHGSYIRVLLLSKCEGLSRIYLTNTGVVLSTNLFESRLTQGPQESAIRTSSLKSFLQSSDI